MPTWEQLRNGVYEVDGSWRDFYVLDATREDWSRWIRFVNAHYPVSWYAEDYAEGKKLTEINEAYITRRWDAGAEKLTTIGSIFIGQVQVVCHFFREEQIENDIDPSQIVSIEDQERVMAYLVAVSKELGKEVIVTAENVPDGPHLRVNGAEIFFV